MTRPISSLLVLPVVVAAAAGVAYLASPQRRSLAAIEEWLGRHRAEIDAELATLGLPPATVYTYTAGQVGILGPESQRAQLEELRRFLLGLHPPRDVRLDAYAR